MVNFEAEVRKALDSLPAGIAAALQNVAIVVEEENLEEPDLYGLFDGIPLTEGGPHPGELPARVTLYRRPLCEDFADPAELEHEIRVTVLHELGHYFGLDEGRLADLGYD
jgi:predicted Zn-dependent protease with MMP-like domain